MPKTRLDRLLVDRGIAPSRERAQAMILAGEVRAAPGALLKPGSLVAPDLALRVSPVRRYVSRAGHKLEAALGAFAIDPAGWVCLDVGASTGGFTDCLLQRGVRRVYAVDVGRGQLATRLRVDPRVVVMERVNARHPFAISEPVDLVVADVSFISLRAVLGPAAALLRPGGLMVVLFKPQFEVGKGKVGKGGVVRDPGLHRQALMDFLDWCPGAGLGVVGLIASPLPGTAGNREFLLALRPGAAGTVGPEQVEQVSGVV